ncbi:MAG: hypothetical protein GY739_19200 [Mesoflavibacter sp.]|nr:hypothetical protein [Mesoflavibacter sp.]
MFKNISSKILIYKCEETGKKITLEPNQTSKSKNDYLIRQKSLCDIGSGVCENVDASADLKKQVTTLKSQLTKANKKIKELEAKIADFNKEEVVKEEVVKEEVVKEEVVKEEVVKEEVVKEEPKS